MKTFCPQVRITFTEEGARAFKIAWLKTIRAFDPSRHCAKCLVGEFHYDILPYGRKDAEREYAGEMRMEWPRVKHAYLCGVTSRWAENLHIGMVYAKGRRVEYEDARIQVVITNMRRLAIPPITEKLALGEAFTTCRNYQFGWAHLRDRMTVKKTGLFG